jgi:hypothetical protein
VEGGYHFSSHFVPRFVQVSGFRFQVSGFSRL